MNWFIWLENVAEPMYCHTRGHLNGELLPSTPQNKYYIKNVLCKEPYTFKLWAFQTMFTSINIHLNLQYYFHLTEEGNRPRDGEQVAQGDTAKWATEAFSALSFKLDHKFPRMGIKPSLPSQAALLYESPEGCEAYSLSSHSSQTSPYFLCQHGVRWWILPVCPLWSYNDWARGFWSCCLAAESCPTLWNPMGCSPPGSSVHRIFPARILEWVAISFSRGSSWPRD